MVKLELVVLTQIMDRLDTMARCQQEIFALLAENVQATGDPRVLADALDVAPPLSPPHARRTRRYASGALVRAILAIMADVDELSIQDLLRALQVEQPGTQMASLRPCVANLVQDGQLTWVRKGVYQLPERKPYLSEVS